MVKSPLRLIEDLGSYARPFDIPCFLVAPQITALEFYITESVCRNAYLIKLYVKKERAPQVSVIAHS
jgi:hypothetical protein